MDKVEGREVEGSALAQGPVTGRGLLLLCQLWSPGAVSELAAGKQSCAAFPEFESADVQMRLSRVPVTQETQCPTP